MARRRSAARIGVTGLGQREELAPGVFINTFYRGCTPGFIYTEEGIVLVDTPLIPAQAMDWRTQIEEEYPDTPFLCLINTDHHRGHALGNQYFLPVRVMAHERAYKEMSGYTENFKERVRNSFKREPEIQSQLNNIIIVPPDITFHAARDAVVWRSPCRVDLCWRAYASHLHRLAAGREGLFCRRHRMGGPTPLHGAGQYAGMAARLGVYP